MILAPRSRDGLRALILLAPLLALAACVGERRTARPAEVIAPESARIGTLPFSPAVRAGDFIFLSGAIGTRPGTTTLVSDDIGEQTRQTLANLETVLHAAGASNAKVEIECIAYRSRTPE